MDTSIHRDNTEPSLEIGRRNDWMEIATEMWMKVQSDLTGDRKSMTEMIIPLDKGNNL